MIIIRVYQLQKGDRFIKTGGEYVVTKLAPGRIYYKRVSDESAGHDSYFGAASQERVEFLFNKKTRSYREM